MVLDLGESSSDMVAAIFSTPFPGSSSLIKKDRKSKKQLKKTKNNINSIPSCESVASLPAEASVATPQISVADGFKFMVTICCVECEMFVYERKVFVIF